VTSAPALAATSTMPLPMMPQPITPTFFTSSGFIDASRGWFAGPAYPRPRRSAKERRSGQGARLRAVVVDLLPSHVAVRALSRLLLVDVGHEAGGPGDDVERLAQPPVQAQLQQERRHGPVDVHAQRPAEHLLGGGLQRLGQRAPPSPEAQLAGDVEQPAGPGIGLVDDVPEAGEPPSLLLHR